MAAYARWRCLHEVVVVGLLIQRCGNAIAEKYLLHDNIESLKAARLNLEYYTFLGYEPLSIDEINALQATNNELIARFGRSYSNEYGWASSVLNRMSLIS